MVAGQAPGSVVMRSPALQIRLFGGLALSLDGVALTPSDSGRTARLLAYLLVHRQTPVAREQLAFLLWPDSSESQARTNLRHVLHTLRRTLPDADRYLAITAHTLQWRPDAPYWLDVAAFNALAAAAETRAAEDDDLATLQDAITIYTGDLLDGWYDDWVLAERERLHQQYQKLLTQLIACLEEGGDLVEAMRHAERLLQQDPLNESSYRLLMRLYAAHGDRARAVRIYHVCVTTLQRELDVEPSPTTRSAYESLLPTTVEMLDAPQIGSSTRSSLVGRVAERDRLGRLWRAADQGQAQCVILTGESGVGKTRLAEEFRSWCAHRGAAVAVARSYAAEGALAYAPIVAWLRSDALARHRQALRPPVLGELARLLPELLAGGSDTATPAAGTGVRTPSATL